MNILLVIPPYRTTDALVAQLYPMPLGPVWLGTVLQKDGHSVALKDFLLPKQNHKAKPPDCFAGLGAPPYKHYGQPLDDCLDWLSQEAPAFDVVGLAMGQCNIFETGQAIAQHVKGLGLPLVIGGPYVSTATDEALGRTGADVAVVGEGELVAAQAFKRALDGHPGVVQGATANLDELPLPDWTLAPPADYPQYRGKVRGVLTVRRGCPHACRFCSVHTIMGRKYRRMAPIRVKEHLVNLWEQGVRYFCFLDDNLFLTERDVDEVLGVISDLDASLPGFDRCRFYLEEGLEVRMAAKPGLVGRLVDSRFDNVALGLETMNQNTLADQGKPYNPQDLRAAVEQCRAAGLTAKAFYIVGFPKDTTASVCKDLVEFGRLGLAARPNNLKLYPGTETTAAYRAAGIIGDDYDWRLSSWFTPTLAGGGLDFKQIKRLKTVLGAIGKVADEFGVTVFADSLPDIRAAVQAKGYEIEDMSGGGLRIAGNMYRPTAYRYLAEFMLLRAGAAGARTEAGEGWVSAQPLDEPKDDIQQGLLTALRPSEALTGVSGSDWADPRWLVGDSRNLGQLLDDGAMFDLLFTCPPYYDLEKYSEDPSDLSNAQSYDEFMGAFREIIAAGAARLRDNRFAVVVVSDIRDGGGFYRNFVSDTIAAYEAAGLRLYNEAILVTAIGSLPVRAGRQFDLARKLGKAHQNVLVFVKGNPKEAVEALGSGPVFEEVTGRDLSDNGDGPV